MYVNMKMQSISKFSNIVGDLSWYTPLKINQIIRCVKNHSDIFGIFLLKINIFMQLYVLWLFFSPIFTGFLKEYITVFYSEA